MQWTVDTLGRRLKGFRNLAIAVGLVILLSLVASIGLRSWRPLCGLSVVIPLCGAFWCRDATRVARWQARVLNLWCEDRLDLDVLAQTLLVTPGVPHQLLRGMLDALPTRSKGFARMTPDPREATTRTMQALDRCQWDKTALATSAYTFGVASLAGVILARSYLPLAGCLLIPLLLGVFHLATGLRLWHWHRRIVALLRLGEDRCEFAETARRLDWGPIPPRQKERWLAALAEGSP
jgi:hypothetical protein